MKFLCMMYVTVSLMLIPIMCILCCPVGPVPNNCLPNRVTLIYDRGSDPMTWSLAGQQARRLP